MLKCIIKPLQLCHYSNLTLLGGVNWNLIKTDGASSCMNATTGGTQWLLEMQIHSSLHPTFHASKVRPQNSKDIIVLKAG